MEGKKKLYQKWWFWVCIALLIIIICIFIYFTMRNFAKTIVANSNEELGLNEQEDSVLCATWKDLRRLEEKDSGTNIIAIGVVDSVKEEYLEDKGHYWTKIGLIMYDDEAYPHLITVIYNRPYTATQILKDDTIWVYGTYQYPLSIKANNIEISK